MSDGSVRSRETDGIVERDGIVGRDPALRLVLARALRVAPTRVPVLITGESGTGKELLARLIHDRGPDPRGPFVAVNCGTLPRELADSELFGHERGAFTGAGPRRVGWFEEAHEGTLVLDEIGELPLELQPKLLRVLETGRLRRVGGRGEVAVRARIVAMTLRELRREIDRGAFRADLYHRLAGFELGLPPLRERPDDIPLLIERFLAEWAPETGAATVDANAMRALVDYAWPGNVRELRNVMRRAAILSSGMNPFTTNSSGEIGVDALELPSASPRLSDARGDGASAASTRARLSDDLASSPADSPTELVEPGDVLPLANQTFAQIERAVLMWALRRHGGNRRRAARALKIARSTFCDKVKRYQLV
jgi:two-component system, response regulator FlrC